MRTKLLRLCITTALLLSAINLAPTEAFAGTQGTACPSGNTYRAHFYENTIGDTSDNNDTYWHCTSGNANMANISHTLSGFCHGFFYHNDWGDCVSSAVFTIRTGYAVCLYNDPNYSGIGMRINQSGSGLRVNMTSATNDEINSFKYINSAFSC